MRNRVTLRAKIGFIYRAVPEYFAREKQDLLLLTLFRDLILDTFANTGCLFNFACFY